MPGSGRLTCVAADPRGLCGHMTRWLGHSSATLGAALCLSLTSCRPVPEHTLVVLSPFDEDTFQSLEQAFERDFPDVDVRLRVVTDADAIEWLSQASHRADVWWGMRPESLLLAEASAPVPVAGSPFVIAFNRDSTALGRAPRDWTDLRHARWRGSLALLDPDTYPDGRDLISGMIALALREGQDLASALDGLSRLDATAAGYWPEPDAAVSSLRTGEATVAILPLHAVESLARRYSWLHYRIPETGRIGVIRGAIVLDGTGNPDLAARFVEYAWEEPTRQSFAEDGWDLFGREPRDRNTDPVQPSLDPAEVAGWLESWRTEVRGRGRSLY